MATIAEPAYVNPPSSQPPEDSPSPSPVSAQVKLDGSLASGEFSGGVGTPFTSSVSGPQGSLDVTHGPKPGNGLSAQSTTHLSAGTGGVSGQQGGQGGLYGKMQGEVSGKYGKASYSAEGKLEGGGQVGFQGFHPTAGHQGTAQGKLSANVSTKPYGGSTNGSVAGKYGTASYETSGNVGADGSLSANGTLDFNGLNLGVQGKLGAEATATLGGKLCTNPMMMGGVPVTGRLEGAATASATLGAHASGSANFTAYPLVASLEGKAGASAGAKIGTTFSVGAGPFTLSGNAYRTAGFEATAGASAGYKNGVLQFGANAGFSPGLGFGGGFQATVDAAQLGQMTSHFINNPTGRPQPSLWDQAAARQQMQQAHAGYYQNVSNWVEGGSW